MSTIISEKNNKGLAKKTLFTSKILSRTKLSQKGSSKATYLVTMDLSSFPSSYQEGDAFAIFPRNNLSTVQELLQHLDLNPKEEIKHPKTQERKRLEDFLTADANLNKITSKLFSLFISHLNQKKDFYLNFLKQDNQNLKKNFLKDHDLLSLSRLLSVENLPAQLFVDALLPIMPRFYSCASSYDLNKSSIDFLISTFEYFVQNSSRTGIGSDYLCHLAQVEKEPILMYLQKNKLFQLPPNPSTPIIMIGPGTGVAPFRAFMQKRHQQNAPQNWLFFGERNKACDFYFENEWTFYRKKNLLDLTLAFSRDQDMKIYVQHRLLEQKRKLLQWLEKGAIIYVCGDASHMEREVKATLIKSFQEELNFTEQEAIAYFKQLKQNNRYLTDVY